MELCWMSVGVVIGILTPALILIFRYLCKMNNNCKGGSVPEPPGAWPILGHLHLLKTTETQRFRIISKLSDEYGPVFALRLGLKQAVFVNDWETAKECFTLNDKALAARPPSTAVGKYICHNDAYFGIASGEYWREMRKITMTNVLCSTKLAQLKQLQVSEIEQFMKELHHHCSSSCSGEVVEISSWFARFSVNMITTLLARKRYPCSPGGGGDDSEKVHTAINELLYAFGLPVMSDAVPWRIVEWWDPQGHIRMMKRIADQLDAVVSSWISDHRQRSMPHHHRGEADFIDVLLCQVGRQPKLKFHNYADEVVIISTIQSIIAGGVDTTSATLTWIVTLLLIHKEAMKLAKEEIEQVVGTERWVEESDIDKLIYLNAVIKETMRLYPAGPLGPPHMTVEECTIGGYRVAKGTKLFCNIWKLQRDPRIWEDPDEFRPERFVGGSSFPDYTYIPFGVGRRICPGKDLVTRVLPLLLARLLQGFDLSPKPSQKHVDVTEGFGAILHKATPLDLVITSRLPPHMYAH